MWRLLIPRLFQAILVVWIVISIVFFVTRVTGDPITFLAPIDASEEELDRIRDQNGLNDPLAAQYLRCLWNAARFDMGNSFRTGQPAFDEIESRLWPTVQLAVASLAFSLVFGVSVGVLSAVKRGTSIDLFARMVALLGQAAPNFWLGIMLILLFSVQFGLLPTGGNTSRTSIVLPAITLGSASSAAIIRLTRAGMLDVLKSDFVRTARAKGLPEHLILWRHTLRHALLPVLTVLGIQIGFILSGSIVVETVFSWPGMGRLMIQSINSSDYPVVQLGVMFTAILIVTANFLVDVCYSYLDPRISSSAI
ncbi:MAG TPA: ABC transporter permease [Opitutaceae bacterium]|nr:ABC transporter permease [Opitutaceae bacterium]